MNDSVSNRGAGDEPGETERIPVDGVVERFSAFCSPSSQA